MRPPQVRGFQGDSLDDPLSEVACVKHFAGDGGTAYGTGDKKEHALLDRGDTQVDEATLRRTHLPGYIAAIATGAATIMPSYSSWNGVKCSANKYLLTDVLKGELGFQGFLISEYNALDLISPDYKSDVASCINAGIDMVMMTKQYPKFFSVGCTNSSKKSRFRCHASTTPSAASSASNSPPAS